jgi:hypothetical protein
MQYRSHGLRDLCTVLYGVMTDEFDKVQCWSHHCNLVLDIALYIAE